ncbi:MAG: methionyl-tRNA formyltransferase [Acidobacteria bacterium]|jgi:methionyl-tRNA formyltransferase|nr:methionyl-tRNA formyltransferase [Acidobacteriota bacterium]
MVVVFLGTPQFAVPTLAALVAAGHQIPAVYTQPDRPAGRGQHLGQSAVKQAALAFGLPVRQPERIRRPEVIEELAAWRADIMVVVGYGQIIPQAIIDLPRLGIVNVHGSLLPHYRGAAPIQWAIANGDAVTGVTTMQINAGLDTGDMLLKAELPILPNETTPELAARLAPLGAELCVRTLAGLAAGTLRAVPQNNAEATLARILTKEDARVDWSRPAAEIHNRLRGFTPWPGAVCQFRGAPLKLHAVEPLPETTELPPGAILNGKPLRVACGGGTVLALHEVQQEGRKKVSEENFRNGQHLAHNEILT